jgi:arylsulfatase A-like enzyme
MHGFDEFMGNLYHLNAEEEPENRDYPADLKLANGKTFREQFGPRGVLKCKADGKANRKSRIPGPLTRKRMETIDEETLAAAKDFINRQHKAEKPFFVLVECNPHAFSHARQGRTHGNRAGRAVTSTTTAWSSTTVHVGELLKLLDDLGLASTPS